MNHPAEELREHLLQMMLIRRFEEVLSDIFAEGLIGGTSHFCIGQEACAVGGVAGLAENDLVASNHRGHGHFLARGADPGRVMAELFGKATGYSGGRGGSQHMADFAGGFLGSNGITGGMLPVATGAALSQKHLQTSRVVLCFFGDGACGNGTFHEAINMAAVWQLPIVYFLENNQYAMSTPVGSVTRVKRLADRAGAYGIPGEQVDGNDYFAVREVTAGAVKRARAGDGPTLIEALTYRCCGHSKSDQCEYRPAGEAEKWSEHDPIRRMSGRLQAEHILQVEEEAALWREAQGRVQAAVEYARNSPDPDPAKAADGVFAEGACC